MHAKSLGHVVFKTENLFLIAQAVRPLLPEQKSVKIGQLKIFDFVTFDPKTQAG
jgi:hypothetical protein